MAAPSRTMRIEAGVVLAGAVLAAVYFTAPLAFQLDRLGRTNSRDGMFSIWNVAWVAHAMVSADDRLLDANIFQPRPLALTYSEANLGPGLLGVPFYLATGNGLAAHNGAVLLAFVLCGLITYGLVRRLTASPGAAAVSAIAFSYCPFVFARTAHIQLMMIWVLPAALLALHVFVDRPSAARAAALGGTLGVGALFCAYYGVLAGLLVGLGIVFYAITRHHWSSVRYWALAVGAAGISAAVVWPIFRHYLALQHAGFSRALEEAAVYSADWQAYFASSATAHEWMLPLLGHWNEVLFPGFVALALGLPGIALGLRTTIDPARAPTLRVRETTTFYLLLGIFSLWASFGPAAGLYAWLYHVLPVFSFLRAPARFAITLSLALSVFAGITLATALARWKRHRGWLIAGALLAVTLDLGMSTPLVPAPEPDPAYRVLASLPRGQVVELPYYYRPEDFSRHAEYMFNSTYHWQPLVNGYSDFIPQDFRDTALAIASFPNPEGFQLLYDRRTRYAVFHITRYNAENRTTLFRQLEHYAPYLQLLSRSEDVLLYRITGWPDSVRRRPAVGTESAPAGS